MVLWALCRELKIKHAVAHFNFQLRSEESEQDQVFVEQMARQYQTELFIRTASAAVYAEEHKLSTQEAAREMRYQWFKELIEAAKADYLITAHHLDDSLETFLINLNRGTGLKGLSGIESHGKTYRPLLDLSKADIVEYAKEHDLEYRDDSSNQKDEYLRNWFRHRLIPIWKEKNPQLLERMKANFSRFKESQSVIDHYLSIELEKRLTIHDSAQEFDLSNFDQYPFPQALLRFWLDDLHFNADQVEQLVQSIRQGAKGGIFYSRTSRILIDRRKLILDQKPNEQPQEFQMTAAGELELKGLHLKVDEVSNQQLDLKLADVEYFDADKMNFPLIFRQWKSGDRMNPLGMKGEKKISDILIDEKVDRFSKEQQLVMLSNSEVAWLLGRRVSEKFKVDPNTKKVIRIRWSKP
jgi:tRNA(Ile)-lysidine synthase